jgi:FkbM family methyltransferase
MIHAQLRRMYHASRGVQVALALPVAAYHRYHVWRHRPVTAMIERLSARISGDVLLDLPEFGGQFACDPRSDLLRRLLYEDGYEPGIAALIRQHLDPERDFIDVGANIGYFTVLGASLIGGGRVLAIEPSTAAHARLVANLARNGMAERTIVFHGVASAQAGELELHGIAGREEYASLAPIAHPAAEGRAATLHRVAAQPLDALVEQHGLNPGLIKIDVEGAEQQVLDGAMEVLRRFRPVVIAELSPALLAHHGSSAAAVLERFAALGYRVQDVADPRARPGARPYGDIVCLPV